VGIRFGTPPSEQVLARYDGAYYAGREEMYTLNRKMKGEEREEAEKAAASTQV
jgi:hypothetical protein